VIYDTLESRSMVLPEAFAERSWWDELRATVERRYNLALDAAEAPTWEQLFPRSPQQSTPAPTQVQAPAPTVAPTPVESTPVEASAPQASPINAGLAAATRALANASRPVDDSDSDDDEEGTPSPQAAADFTAAVQNLDSGAPTPAFTSDFGLDGETASSAGEDITANISDDDLFPPQLLVDEGLLDEEGSIKSAFAPSPGLRQEFASYLERAEITPDLYSKVIALLKNTFGPKFGKASNIPSENLAFFIDHFDQLGGPAALKRAVERTEA
jgi:hypothetical protein